MAILITWSDPFMQLRFDPSANFSIKAPDTKPFEAAIFEWNEVYY